MRIAVRGTTEVPDEASSDVVNEAAAVRVVATRKAKVAAAAGEVEVVGSGLLDVLRVMERKWLLSKRRTISVGRV